MSRCEIEELKAENERLREENTQLRACPYLSAEGVVLLRSIFEGRWAASMKAKDERIAELEADKDRLHAAAAVADSKLEDYQKRVADLEVEVEVERLREEIAEYEKAIKNHNAKMANLPHTDNFETPKTPAAGLNLLADWFDAIYQDAGTGADVVQQDLRRWSDTFTAYEQRIAELEEQRKLSNLAVNQNLRLLREEVDVWKNLNMNKDSRIAELEAELELTKLALVNAQTPGVVSVTSTKESES